MDVNKLRGIDLIAKDDAISRLYYSSYNTIKTENSKIKILP